MLRKVRVLDASLWSLKWRVLSKLIIVYLKLIGKIIYSTHERGRPTQLYHVHSPYSKVFRILLFVNELDFI